MTETPAQAKPRPAKPAKRPRGEGQWALGYREPLNANEQSKKDDNPLNVRQRIEDIYAPGGFDTIDKGDLRVLLPATFGYQAPFSMIMRRGRSREPLIQTFRDLLKAQLNQA